MIKSILLLVLSVLMLSQNDFKFLIVDHENNKPLIGVDVYIQNLQLGGITNENGYVSISNIPNGKQSITISLIGYEKKNIDLIFPTDQSQPLKIELEHHEEESEEVIITATRSSRTIADNPTRIEAISGEELQEKGNMKPGDIRMLLNESTGIQTQQTSATSYNSSIRIQGLDGKYTQILKDGFPLYGSFSGGLSLLQIVPLDLKQVEVIKGASSTLYGGDAIAGLVNLVSKTPSEEKELNVLLNFTSALGVDASTFYSTKNDKIGSTLFASYNAGSSYDPADIGFTAIPKFDRYTFNPKLYYYLNDKVTLNVGLNTIYENRVGGDIEVVRDESKLNHTYFEKNKTTRINTLAGLDIKFNSQEKMSFKNSFSHYDRELKMKDYVFSGQQISSFTEVNYNYKSDYSEWIIGLNFSTDHFEQESVSQTNVVDYTHSTIGAFLQNTWNTTEKLIFESGMRIDRQNNYGTFLLPRHSILYKFDSELSIRIGGGFGYKTPTIFTEESERLQFRNILPINSKNIHAEESRGVNFDINYRTALSDEITFSINNLLFYTRINDPLILSQKNNQYEFLQPVGYLDSKGLETNIKLTYDHLKLFIGYTLADVKEHYNSITNQAPLVSKHRLNNVLMYEKHNVIRLGLEAYYFSQQNLSNNKIGKEYWIMGLMTEKMWEGFSIFLNFENFLDTRQTKFEQIYTGPISNPVFNEIYAPVDGFVINGGIKLKF